MLEDLFDGVPEIGKSKLVLLSDWISQNAVPLVPGTIFVDDSNSRCIRSSDDQTTVVLIQNHPITNTANFGW